MVAYRLSPLHPLARYPGPLLCKVSALWLAYKSTSGTQHRYVKSLHDRYGDVVRIGPNNLSIRRGSAISALLGASGMPKGPHHIGRHFSEKDPDLLSIPDTEHHLRRRRAWARGLTSKALKEYEEQMALRVNQLVSRLQEQKGEVHIDEWFNRFTYDFMSDMALGGGSNLLDGEKTDFWSSLNEEAKPATFFGHVPWLGVLVGRLPIPNGHKMFIEQCRVQAVRRMQRGTTTPDLFYYISHEDVQDSKYARPTIDQILSDGILAMVAGSDTIATTLTAVVACLLTYPAVYKQLQEEVDRFYPPGEVVHTKHHQEMHYLTAVINETLRLFSAVPSTTQRKVPSHGQGITVESLYIPPGTSFWVPAYSIHRDPRDFSPSPEAYLPERWLPEWKEASAAHVHNEGAFIPFSYGPMNCVGKGLAMQEMRMVVCALLQRFKLRPRQGWDITDYEGGLKDYFVTVREHLPVILKPRGKNID
ncbi:cytochrome P450 [Dichomitus squalens LYAD-421 SS1]|uniref:Cytochrome P450 n=1 Tax=Dichomitus squalens (strain LYAD-421) TaxID=732165 RepID=R7T0U3_DICSQ|nr:cytochrome P450 [Dichomitus squalens LYAD-421 SS1]EJF60792.1 cytochrome P450 [Dichomitus squalens LYAD-421 SS1]